MVRPLALVVLTAALVLPFHARAAGTDGRLTLLAAMKEELARSKENLKLKDHEPPYFVSYQLKDMASSEIVARYGAIFSDRYKHDARLYVDIRVGTYEHDSSEGSDEVSFLLGDDGPTYQAGTDGPLVPDPEALRNALWLLTDQKYKTALSSWLKKRSKAVFAADDPDKGGSFSKEEPVHFVQDPVPFPFKKDFWRARAATLSDAFRDYPAIFDSEVRVSADKVIRLQTTSEGTSLVTEDTIYGVHVQAATRAPDGQLLDDSRDWYATDESALPPQDTMLADSRDLAEKLLLLRKAKVIDPYTGPALLEPQATGVMFHETLGHRLEGDRQDDDNEGRTFKGQVGQRVLPQFLTVVDDPTVRTSAKEQLNGFYRYDDEGVAGERTTLIEDGVLRNFLLGRKPVKGFDHSNGHGRAQGNRAPVARMANLFVLSKKQVSEAELKKMLIEEARKQKKPYALIIKDISGGNTNTSSYGYQAFKGIPRLVYRVDATTGAEELVRGVEIVGTPLTSMNKIVATGDTMGVFNGYCGAESGYVPVSTVAPAALISEMELQRTVQANERAPILPAPWTMSRKAATR